MNNVFKIFLILSFLSSHLYADEKVSLQLLWKHQFEFAGFYIAQEKGFYKDSGLDVSIKEYDFDVDIVGDVLNGESHIGIGRSSLILDKLAGKEIVLLNALYQNSPYVLIAKERSDLQSINDFKNKTIMLSDPTATAAIISMMKIHDIRENDYTTLSHSFDINDLIEDKVDVMSVYLSNEPYELTRQKIPFKIFDPKSAGVDFYADLLFTSQKYLDTNQKNIDKFQESSLKGWEYAFSNIEETVDLILKKYNTQNKSREALLYEAYALKDLAYAKNIPLGSIDELRTKEIANVYRLLGFTNKPNKYLKNFIYKQETWIQKIFSWQLFFGITFLVILSSLLSLYKQSILKKQNQVLEDVVEEKTQTLLEYTKELESQKEQLLESQTELKTLNENLEKRIQERTQELEYAVRVKSDFLANMSHEIRTPLNGIIGFIDILHKNETNIAKLKQLNVVKESGSSLLSIINDILDFSKLENNKVLIEKVPIDIHKIFKHITELFFSKASEKDINILLHISDNVPENALGDSTRIKQVVSNLLSNAIKFSYEHTNIDIYLNYTKTSNMLECEIRDHGAGIAPENIQTIFHSFEQADSSVTRTHGGTGLGLAISKSLVQLMGGNIHVTSELGVGSSFTFSIELKETQEELKQLAPIQNELLDLKGKVLIVEDNKTNQMLLSILLDDLGLESDIVNDGLEAIEAVKNTPNYAIILMDENMPNMNGKAATKIIRTLEKSKDIPIIAVTANALQGDKEKFLKAGMNDYISKPIDSKKLNLILSKYL